MGVDYETVAKYLGNFDFIVNRPELFPSGSDPPGNEHEAFNQEAIRLGSGVIRENRRVRVRLRTVNGDTTFISSLRTMNGLGPDDPGVTVQHNNTMPVWVEIGYNDNSRRIWNGINNITIPQVTTNPNITQMVDKRLVRTNVCINHFKDVQPGDTIFHESNGEDHTFHAITVTEIE